MASRLSPDLVPAHDGPVSAGAANGSKPALHQSLRIARQVAIANGDSNSSTYDSPAEWYDSS